MSAAVWANPQSFALGTAPSHDALPAELPCYGYGEDINLLTLQMKMTAQYQVLKREALYTALPLAVVRDLLYTGIQVGVIPTRMYAPARDSAVRMWNNAVESFGDGFEMEKANLPIKFGCGFLSGGVARAATAPLQLLNAQYLVATNRECRKSKSRGFVQAALQMHRDGGLSRVWRGLKSNILRASLFPAAQLASYDEVKQKLLAQGVLEEGKMLHFTTSALASLLVIGSFNTIDAVKSRIPMSPHKTMYGTAQHMLKTEGPHTLMCGVKSAWPRMGPPTILSFMIWEKMRELAGVAPI